MFQGSRLTQGMLSFCWGLMICLSGMADEGMYPVNQLDRLDLDSKGLKLSAAEIFNPDQISLVDAIVRVNGCTGSFVSSSGLIFTNHHCAYAAIQQASSADRDLLRDGFAANSLEEEIPAQGYVVRVTQTVMDVSQQMLSAVDDRMTFTQRTKALEQRQKEIEAAAEREFAGLRAEVAEMFIGKTYYLFLYTYIKDVRLVFAPPKSIGKFGGDIDNWQWPRHTGDFAFMRAYVAADGSSADFSPDNVPFQPKRHFQVAAEGVEEGDFVMLLGYPGRTARHRSARYLQFLEEDFLPTTVELYQTLIELMERVGREDREIAIKNLARIQSLANVEKRSRGQLKGLASKPILLQRQESERQLAEFIAGNTERQQRYGGIFGQLDKLYRQMSEQHLEQFNFQNLNQVLGLAIANSIVDGVSEREKPDLERESPFMDRNFPQTVERLLVQQKNYNSATDREIFALMMQRLPWDDQKYGTVDLDSLYAETRIADPDFIQECLTKSVEELQQLNDPFIGLAIRLYPDFLRQRELEKTRTGELNKLYGDLISVKQEFLKTDFVPDANGTLRLTFGTIRGYSPADAVQMTPFTTLSGLLAKTTGQDPFETPARVAELHQAGQLDPFRHPRLKDVPVAMLYDTDTTGGNSGSPVINARGELVGVNFDRTFEATINDFAWNTDYSRSIGVDMRYALWVTGVVYQSERLLSEMGIPLK